MTTPAPDIFDDIIDSLKRRKLAGEEAVVLAPDTLRALFASPKAVRSPIPPRPAPRTPRRTDQPVAGSHMPPPSAAAAGFAPPRVSPAPDVETADWDTLVKMVDDCVRCPLHKTRTNPVFGEVNREADLLFIGEGPGFHEDQIGRPFVGPAGQQLDKMIQAMQFTRESVYITNIVKCRPPGNRNPNDSEARVCLPFLKRQIDLIQPKAIVLLGAVPLQFLMGKTGITSLHGKWLDYQGIPVMPTFHPSFLLRSPARKKEAWEDLQLVMKKLGKDPGETLRRMRAGR
ncbi:MAG: uracil-DNA glycosylase [Lentisphaeria bacterium]|nr:uracil-DNA glycosylase [Lentisphaeria bacterium]